VRANIRAIVPQAAPQASGGSEFKPHLFGKFFLLQRVAVGGMAEIYRARVPGAGGFEKELVVKRILPARAQDQGFIKMLVNEAKLTVQLTHSNIAQIYECGSIEGNYFISMELVNGVSLKEMMAAFAGGRDLTPEQAIFVVLQLLHGLDYAHRRSTPKGAPSTSSIATSHPTTRSSPGRASSSCSTSASRAPRRTSPTTRRGC
jgi:serine/threonine protein kinase